jgi:hypothetical protein
MYESVAAVLAGKAKVLGVVLAAVVAGGAAGGYVAASGSDDTSITLRSNGGQSAEHRAAPHATGSPGAQGVHGKCVSAVARDHNAVGGPHNNHGGAVSAAAHSCPHGNGAAGHAKPKPNHSDDAGD